MSKKEEFKEFAKKHPNLVSLVNSGEVTWQKLYETYDIYGEDENAWKEYLSSKKSDESRAFSFKDLGNLAKGIDVNNIQKHVGTAQKALNLVQEMTSKGLSDLGSGIAGVASGIAAKGPKTPRPINKFFED